jgi:hypothetical protein
MFGPRKIWQPLLKSFFSNRQQKRRRLKKKSRKQKKCAKKSSLKVTKGLSTSGLPDFSWFQTYQKQ